MADIKQDNAENKKEVLPDELREPVVEKTVEQFESSKHEDFSEEEKQSIREKIEKTDIDDSLKMQASSQAKDLSSMKDDEKIKELLEIAHKKGVVYAVTVAKKTGDSYLVDMFHDTLAKEGLYKQIK